MNESLLRKIGFTSKTITVVAIVAGAFFVYNTILQSQLTRLQIKQIKGELKTLPTATTADTVQ